MPENTQIKLFEEKKVRSVWEDQEQQWYLSVIDVVEVLTESVNPRDYWFKMIDQDGKIEKQIAQFLLLKFQKQLLG